MIKFSNTLKRPDLEGACLTDKEKTCFEIFSYDDQHSGPTVRAAIVDLELGCSQVVARCCKKSHFENEVESARFAIGYLKRHLKKVCE